MDVKQAVAQAKNYVADLFEEEEPANVALEEVEYRDSTNEWLITVGFTRPWEAADNSIPHLASVLSPRRSFKVVCISDETGDIRFVKNHETLH